jgi:hypothetical protein
MKICVYTAVFWDYDVVLQQTRQTINCEFIVFTDNPDLKFENEIARSQRRIFLVDKNIFSDKGFLNNLPDRMKARFFKMYPFKFLPDVDIAIRMDAMWMLLQPNSLEVLLSNLKRNTWILAFQHPNRTCPYEEAEFIATLKHKKFEWLDMESQMNRYRAEWFPEQFWLTATTILISRNTRAVKAFMDRRRQELITGTNRDQLSFDYLVRKLWLRVDRFALGYGNNLRTNKRISFLTHHRKNT